MKKIKNIFSLLKPIIMSSLVVVVGCTTENELDANLLNSSSQNASVGDSVNIDNPGFEDGSDDWNGSFAISGDTNSGSSSGKLSSSSRSISQTVSVSRNTNYTLSAYILGSGTLGATANGSDYEVSDEYDDNNWTKVSVQFNSGSSTSATIYADYYNDEGRFDDFELIEGSGEGVSFTGQRFEEMVGKTVRIENVASNLWLRITNSSDYADVEIVSQSNTGTWPRWVVEEVVEDGKYYYRFNNVRSNRRFRPSTADSGSNINLGKTTWTGNWTQWEISSDGNGNYTFKNKSTGTYLSTVSSAPGSIANSISNTNGANSTWRIEDLEGNDANEEEENNPPTGNNVEDIIGDFWKLTVPVDEDGNASPTNCTEYDCRNNDAVDLYGLNGIASNNNYSDYFYESNGWVVFTAFCGGATTTNSQYPRSELRGLDASGDDSYFDLDDYQELEVTVKVLDVPIQRPEVNMVQVHGPDNEPLRVEYNDGSQGSNQGLHITYNESNVHEDVIDYEIGQELKVKVVIQNGNIEIWLNNLSNGDSYNTDWNAEDSTGYFKVGCYLQGSISYCDVKSNESFCKNGGESDDYWATGSVAVKDLSLIRDGQTYK